MMAHCSEDFNTLVISSTLFHKVPLFFMSWNCGWKPNEGNSSLDASQPPSTREDTLITKHAPAPKGLRSNKDPCQTGFFGMMGDQWEGPMHLWGPYNGDHFSDPICRRKSNAECDRCRSLRCSLHYTCTCSYRACTRASATIATRSATSRTTIPSSAESRHISSPIPKSKSWRTSTEDSFHARSFVKTSTHTSPLLASRRPSCKPPAASSASATLCGW